MNPEENNQDEMQVTDTVNKGSNSMITYVFVVIIILLLALLGYGIYTYVKELNLAPSAQQPSGDDVSSLPSIEELREAVDGRIVMSLTPKNNEQPTNLHFYFPKNTEQPVVQYTGNTIHAGFEFVAGNIAYHTAEDNDVSDGDPLDIFRTDFVGLETTRVVTDGEISERALSWSPESELLLYTAQTEESDDYVENIQSENWHVTIYDPATGEKNVVDDALYGTWLPGGTHFIFARKDGLHIYDTVAKKSTNVFRADWKISAQDMFDVSPDGKHLAIAIPGLNQVRLYQVVSDKDFIVEQVYRLGTEGTNYYWPVFSRDPRFFVIQAIDAGDNLQERTNFRAEIYSVYYDEVLTSQSLDDYYSDQAFIDDWI